jgi:hypothetical protein
MDLHRETTYAADPEAVFAMLVDEDFLRRRAEASHALSYDVDVTYNAGAATSKVRQSLPAEVPDFLRKLVGNTIELTETITWEQPEGDRSRAGRIEVAVANAPVSLKGTITLSLGSDGTRQVVDAELKASVPLIGRKIEEAAQPAVIAGIDGMQELGQQWLSR